jgi:hypothetical protein
MASSQSPASPHLEIQVGSNQQCADLHRDDKMQPPCPLAATIQYRTLLPLTIDNYTRTPTLPRPPFLCNNYLSCILSFSGYRRHWERRLFGFAFLNKSWLYHEASKTQFPSFCSIFPEHAWWAKSGKDCLDKLHAPLESLWASPSNTVRFFMDYKATAVTTCGNSFICFGGRRKCVYCVQDFLLQWIPRVFLDCNGVMSLWKWCWCLQY